ncbi:BQ2448_1188 [Microbotryum intermedium]|uniref:D-lactate dehydrogenase (cytochrome) n=1 Tax=Microbotryum intermedium TaxID=269621 RepID=A0A238FD37_9BASI|nr:BQ2448_1188 [Microbotryum intermedium]
MSPGTPDISGALTALHSTFPASQLSEDAKILTQFGSSFGSFAPPTPPLIVVHAESTQDVVSCVKIARRFLIVLIPVGGRTSLEGHKLNNQIHRQSPDRRSISPSLVWTRFQRFPRISAPSLVRPGAGWQSLNQHLAEQGIKQFFPIDPAPRSEFGGMVAVAGSGTNAVGFGTMRGEWIGGMEVVWMSGEVIKTKGSSRARELILQASEPRRFHPPPRTKEKTDLTTRREFQAQYWSQQLLLSPTPGSPPCRTFITDICVPISQLPLFISRSEALVNPLSPKRDPRTLRLALDLEGTVAGEHGIGMTKRKYVRKELGQKTLGLMRKVRTLLDPMGLLNPGKVIYETVEEETRESRLWIMFRLLVCKS